MGEPSVRRLVRLEDMRNWLFYADGDEMVWSYENGTAYGYRSSQSRQLAIESKAQQ